MRRHPPSPPRGPGIFLVLPCLDDVVVVDMRTGVLDIPSQDILTSDSIAVSVDAILYFRVRDPLQAVVGNDNYVTATEFKVAEVGPAVSRRRRR